MKKIGKLSIHPLFQQFVEDELLAAVGLDVAAFWESLETLVSDLTPLNQALLEKRDALQANIDAWHIERRGQPWDHEAYLAFLRSIGYLVEPGEPFTIGTQGVDDEIANIAGPQLVVPVSNARFALNAANARWGSLYDALYGTDVIDSSDGREPGAGYNPRRGDAVIGYAREFLDCTFPLSHGSHADVQAYAVDTTKAPAQLVGRNDAGDSVGLEDPTAFRGWAEDDERRRYLLRHHGLHVEIQTDPGHAVGATRKPMSAMSSWKLRLRRFRIARTRWRRWMRRTRSACIATGWA